MPVNLVFRLTRVSHTAGSLLNKSTICASLVIAFLDDFAEKITQKTVVVVDNASIHHCDQFKDKIK